MNTNPNDKAFPEFIVESLEGQMRGVRSVAGLTKREYFAAMAMQGLMANPLAFNTKNVAEYALKTADDLIAEMNK